MRADAIPDGRMAKVVKVKKKCCKSGPRCKKCPVVCKRLVNQGLAERAPNGSFVIHKKVPKKVLKAARA
jgi:aldehyde:ferredoxin oxidoreductase